MDGESRMRVRTYLERRLTREFDRLMEARNRENIADDRRQIYLRCEYLDDNLESYLSRDRAFSANALDDAEDAWPDGEKGDVVGVQGSNDVDGIEKEMGEYTTHGWDGTSRVDKENAVSDESKQRENSENGTPSEAIPRRYPGDTRFGYPVWPIATLVVLVVVWLVGGTYGMYVVYSEVNDLHNQVTSLHGKVDGMMFPSEPGSTTSSEVQELVGNIEYIRGSLSDAQDGAVVPSPLVKVVRSLNADIEVLKDELVHENGDAKAGSLMERVHMFEQGTLRVLKEEIISDLSTKLLNLNGRVSRLKIEVEKLTESEDRDSPMKSISALTREVGGLERRIRELTDETNKNSLAYAIKRLDAEMLILRTARLYRGDPRECRRVQRELAGLDYYKHTVDGLCGANTEAAIMAFQDEHGLDESGVLETDHVRLLRVKAQRVGRGGGGDGIGYED